jgi:hypothetical protein
LVERKKQDCEPSSEFNKVNFQDEWDDYTNQVAIGRANQFKHTMLTTMHCVNEFLKAQGFIGQQISLFKDSDVEVTDLQTVTPRETHVPIGTVSHVHGSELDAKTQRDYYRFISGKEMPGDEASLTLINFQSPHLNTETFDRTVGRVFDLSTLLDNINVVKVTVLSLMIASSSHGMEGHLIEKIGSDDLPFKYPVIFACKDDASFARGLILYNLLQEELKILNLSLPVEIFIMDNRRPKTSLNEIGHTSLADLVTVEHPPIHNDLESITFLDNEPDAHRNLDN